MPALSTFLARTTISLGNSLVPSWKGLGTGFGLTEDQSGSSDPQTRFRQALFERDDASRFLEMFPELDLTDARVLDFGCGYGGKTIDYAAKAEFVAGIEPFETMVAHAQAYAEHEKTPNVDFKVCSQDNIPYPDESFDILLSHDVLEHVDNPEESLREVHRVLKPGGRAFFVFPAYWGARSHHLDYLTQMPILHWIFPANALVDAVNELLPNGDRKQPAPKRSWNGSHKVLPTLNGLSGQHFERLAHSLFDVERITHVPLGSGGRNVALRLFRKLVSNPAIAMGGVPRDMVTASIIAVLRKPV